MRQLFGAQLYDGLLALPTNIRLGWKSLTMANNPAYYYDRKKFYNIGHCTKTFYGRN